MASAIGSCRPTMNPANVSGMSAASASGSGGATGLGVFGISGSIGSGPSIGAGSSSAGFFSGSSGSKPVPMKLFATWEVDRTPPNCIPRLCTLTLTRLVLNKPLGSDLTSVIIAVKMQSSKTLRSNEILLPASGLLDTELELTFSLQYPHFLKREGNQLHVMLQRRKRYKNRTILGFKTLAVGIINMSQVLQKQMDLELELYSDVKDKTSGNAIGKIFMLSLSSQPVDHEDPSSEQSKGVQEESVDREMYSDEDEDYSSPEEGSDSEPMLEDLPRSRLLRKARGGSGKGSAAAARQRNIKQKFVALLKKFKVTDPGDLDHDQSLDQKLEEASEIEDLFEQLEDLSDSGPDLDTISIGSTPKPSLKPFFCSSRNLLQEARGNVTSVSETHSKSHNQGTVVSDRQSDESSKEGVSDSHPETLTDPEFSDPPIVTSSPPQSGDEVKKEKSSGRQRLFPKEIRQSAFSLKQGNRNKDHMRGGTEYRSRDQTESNPAPRKVLLEQLSRMLPSDSDSRNILPDQIIMVNTCDRQAAHVAAKLEERGGHRVVCTAGPADVRATLTCLVAKIQRFCNTKTQSPPSVKVVLIGSDIFINSLLRPYVEVFSSKPPDWQSYVRFFVVPLGCSNTVAKYIAFHDSTYASLFLHESWRELLEKAEPGYYEVNELVSRIEQYISSCGPNTMHLPVAEAMVTYKEKSFDDESSQVFVPFISDVRVGADNLGAFFDGTDPDSTLLVGSPPSQVQSLSDKQKLTPPSSPHVGNTAFSVLTSSPSSKDKTDEPMDLQLDYWTVFDSQVSTSAPNDAAESSSKSESKSSQKSNASGGGSGGDGKFSIKSSIWFMQIQRLSFGSMLPLSIGGAPDQQQQPTFSMQYRLKEKKQKTVMRLGKRKEKEKESGENKSTNVDGVTRLICLSKGQNPLKVFIDGSEWSGVKFFQLSSLWQTHIKYFPVATFNTGTQTIP